MKYPIAYLQPMWVSTSLKALLIFLVLTPATIYLSLTGIRKINATGIVMIQTAGIMKNDMIPT